MRGERINGTGCPSSELAAAPQQQRWYRRNGAPAADENLLRIDVVPSMVDGRRTLYVDGDVDGSTSALLEACIDLQLRAVHGSTGTGRPRGDVVVDLTAVSFLNASGLRALVTGYRRAADAGVEMHVRCGDRRAVRRPMEVTGLLDLLPVVD